jgi:hypothetical protein
VRGTWTNGGKRTEEKWRKRLQYKKRSELERKRRPRKEGQQTGEWSMDNQCRRRENWKQEWRQRTMANKTRWTKPRA